MDPLPIPDRRPTTDAGRDPVSIPRDAPLSDAPLMGEIPGYATIIYPKAQNEYYVWKAAVTPAMIESAETEAEKVTTPEDALRVVVRIIRANPLADASDQSHFDAGFIGPRRRDEMRSHEPAGY